MHAHTPNLLLSTNTPWKVWYEGSYTYQSCSDIPIRLATQVTVLLTPWSYTQQPMPALKQQKLVGIPPASTKETTRDFHHEATSQKPLKVPAKAAHQKVSPPQKMVVDNSNTAKAKFAIVSSLNTIAPVTYARREPQRPVNTNRLVKRLPGDDAKESTPASRATSRVRSRASETSYQRQIVSQAECLETESNDTAQSVVLSLDRGSGERSRTSIAKKLECSSSTLQSGSTRASLTTVPSSFDESQVPQSPDRSLSVDKASSCRLSPLSNQVDETENADLELSRSCLHSEMEEFQYPSTHVSQPQSGTLKLSIDMRFPAVEQGPQDTVSTFPLDDTHQRSPSATSVQSRSSAGFTPDEIKEPNEDGLDHDLKKFHSSEKELESASHVLTQTKSVHSELPSDSLSSIKAGSKAQLSTHSVDEEVAHPQTSRDQHELGMSTSDQFLSSWGPHQAQPWTRSTVINDSSQVTLPVEEQHHLSAKLSSHSRLEKDTMSSSSTLHADSSNTAFSTPFTGSLSSLGAPFSLPSGSQTGTSTSDRHWDSSSTMSGSRERSQEAENGDKLSSVMGSGELLPSTGSVLPPALRSSEQLAATTSYFFASMPSPVKTSAVPPESTQSYSIMNESPTTGNESGSFQLREGPKGGVGNELKAKSSQFTVSMSAMTQASDMALEEDSNLQTFSELSQVFDPGRQSVTEMAGASPSALTTDVEVLSGPTNVDPTVQEKRGDRNGVPVDQLAVSQHGHRFVGMYSFTVRDSVSIIVHCRYIVYWSYLICARST